MARTINLSNLYSNNTTNNDPKGYWGQLDDSIYNDTSSWRELQSIQILEQLRFDLDELSQKNTDAVLAAIKDAGFEAKVIKRIEKISKQKVAELHNFIIDKFSQLNDLNKKIEGIEKEMNKRLEILNKVVLIAKELDYQLQVSKKPF